MTKGRLATAAGTITYLVLLFSPGPSVPSEPIEQETSFKLIWSKSIDEKLTPEEGRFFPEEIRRVLQSDNVPEQDKEWLLNWLRIMVARQQRVVYTNDGRAIELPKNGLLRWHIAASKNCKYMMLCPLRWDWEAKSTMESIASTPPHDPTFGAERVELAKKNLEEYERLEKESNFVLMDWKGIELWRRHDMPGRVCISDDARTLVATHRGHFFASASFYDENGNVVRKAEFPYGRGGNADLSAGGSLFVVIAGLGSEDGFSTLIGYDRLGNAIWERNVKGKPHYGGDTKVVAVSDSGSFTVASVGDSTYLLDSKGTPVCSFDISDADCQVFSPEEDYLVLQKGRELRFIKTRPPTVVWSYESDYAIECLGEAAFIPRSDMVLATLVSRSSPHMCDVVAFRNGEIVDTVITVEGKGASLGSSPGGHFAVISTGTICATYGVQEGRQTSKWRPRFLMSTVRATEVYATSDTLEQVDTLAEGTGVQLTEIEGDNEWVRVKAGGIEGWVRARDVKLELRSFVAGYKLHFMGGLPVSQEEFRARSGMTWEEAKELLFETKEQAKAFGDSLAAEGLVRREDATGLYYWVWFVFDDEIQSLHPSWSGGGESLGRAECPVCGEVLARDREPGKHIKRVRDCIYSKDLLPPDGKEAQELSWLEIYQCVNGHLVVVQKIPVD